MLNKIVLASHNIHKLEEIKAILAPLGIMVVGATEAGLKDVEETGESFSENALIKARAAHQQTGLAVLSDDSGLCIHALDGNPGIHSARFAQEHGGYPAVFDEVWARMGNTQDRTAHFMCCMAFIDNQGKEFLFTGKMTGKIDTQATGTHLFGYDPIFIPDGYTVSCGVLDSEIKNKLSHRAKALDQFTRFIKQENHF